VLVFDVVAFTVPVMTSDVDPAVALLEEHASPTLPDPSVPSAVFELLPESILVWALDMSDHLATFDDEATRQVGLALRALVGETVRLRSVVSAGVDEVSALLDFSVRLSQAFVSVHDAIAAVDPESRGVVNALAAHGLTLADIDAAREVG
jgi:hypothetical protein